MTTNGGTAARVTRNPLSAPNNPPTSSVAAKPTVSASGAAPVALALANQCAITQAPAVPAQPSTAPTDRSMPPEQITNVSPTASSSTSVAVLDVFSQLARVRK